MVRAAVPECDLLGVRPGRLACEQYDHQFNPWTWRADLATTGTWNFNTNS